MLSSTTGSLPVATPRLPEPAPVGFSLGIPALIGPGRGLLIAIWIPYQRGINRGIHTLSNSVSTISMAA